MNNNLLRIVAVALIALGVLALVYRTFTYTKETHEAKVGPLQLQVQEKDSFTVPAWAGVAAIVVGGGILMFTGFRR
jgi:TRAP-type C4-dicarboxylate transport system permease small subunit